MPLRALAGLLLVLACSPAAPQPAPENAAPENAAAPAEPPAKPPIKSLPRQRIYTPEELDKIGPRPPPEPPLTQEELDLLAVDPATLTKEQRVKQAYARRRKTLQNPDSPMARRIEAMRQQHLRGELPLPTLPHKRDEPNMSLPPDPAKAP